MSPPLDCIRVFLLEDDQDLVGGLLSVLGTQHDCVVTHVAHSVAEAARFLEREESFDVALVDLGLPDGSGLSIIEAIASTRSAVRILAFTQFDDPGHIFPALRAGAVGYLLKSTSPPRLLAALREAVAGGSPLSPQVARYLVSEFSQAALASPLTPREQAVLSLLTEGKAYGEIALALRVEVSTVQTHVKAVYKKLHVNSRQEAQRKAARLGLLSSGSHDS